MSGDAQRIIRVIRQAIDQEVGAAGRADYRYGQIHEGGGAYEVSAYLSGDDTPTEYIRQNAGGYASAGDYVIVVATSDGDAWIDQVLPYSLYSKLAVDYSRGRIFTGDGDTLPSDPGEEGQTLHSGGPDAPAYWDW